MSKELNLGDEKDIGSEIGGEKGVESGSLQLVNRHPVHSKPWWKLGGTDSSFVSVDAGYAKTTSASSSSSKLGSHESLGQHVWETEEAKEIYKPIEGYEGAHRFDPSLQWTPEEEQRLVRTVSLRFHLKT
jgi:MFS transporter, ACS family, DAL5 transporter family protein